MDIDIAQHATSEGVFLKITLTQPSAIIAYARDSVTGRLYDLKELLTITNVHYTSLRIPSNHSSTNIVVRPILNA